jgi:hypothetical protein
VGGNEDVHEHGFVFARVRHRGHRGDDQGLAYMEWSADADLDTVEQIAGEARKLRADGAWHAWR